MKRVLIILLACAMLAGCAAPAASQEQEPTQTAEPTPEPTPEPEGLLKEFGKDEVVAVLYGDSEEISKQILLQAQSELESMGVTCEIFYKDVEVDGFDLAVIHTQEDESEFLDMCTGQYIPVAVISPNITEVEVASSISFEMKDTYIQLMEAVMGYEHHTTPVRMMGVFNEADSEAAKTYSSYISQGKVMDKQTIVLSGYEVEIPEEEIETSEEETADFETSEEDENSQPSEDDAEESETSEDSEEDDAEGQETSGDSAEVEEEEADVLHTQHYEALNLHMTELFTESYFEGMLDAIIAEDEKTALVIAEVFEELGRSDVEICTVGTSMTLTDEMIKNPDLFAYECVVDLTHAGTHAARFALMDLRDGVTSALVLEPSLVYAEEILSQEETQTSDMKFNEAWMDELRMWAQNNM